jgi:hypothetical protein
LRSADISDSVGIDVILREAEMSRSSLKHTSLRNSDLTNIKLAGGNLFSCNLEGAKTTGANINRAYLVNCSLSIDDEYSVSSKYGIYHPPLSIFNLGLSEEVTHFKQEFLEDFTDRIRAFAYALQRAIEYNNSCIKRGLFQDRNSRIINDNLQKLDKYNIFLSEFDLHFVDSMISDELIDRLTCIHCDIWKMHHFKKNDSRLYFLNIVFESDLSATEPIFECDSSPNGIAEFFEIDPPPIDTDRIDALIVNSLEDIIVTANYRLFDVSCVSDEEI